MPEESILTDDFLRELMNVGEVDILVGVPTFNDAKTVAPVVQAIRAGLLKYFPRQRAVIINADGGSKDPTQELVRAASITDMVRAANIHALRTLHCISTQYAGGAASGTALHTIVAAADLLRARACAVISADSLSITPEWLEGLLRPVHRESFDLVTPLYRRHKFDGLLVRNLVYPMTRAVYAKRIREPHPPDFAFSGRLAGHFLGEEIWTQDIARTGAEMFLTVSAITGGFSVAQSYLGPKARVEHSPSDLVPAMRQTVGGLFWSLDPNFAFWSAQNGSQAVPTFGADYEIALEPLRVNRKHLHQMFVRGVADLEPVLKTILSASTLAELQRVAALPEDDFCYSDELWVRTVYDLAAAHHKTVISRDHIVQALAPLYRGKTYTFLAQNREAPAEELERNVESLSQTFERMKPYLLEQWNGQK